jgi:predicted PurR-regulated permease PerM
MASLSLILGIVAIVLRFVPFIGGFIGTPVALAGAVLAVLARKKEPHNANIANAGLICSLVALFINVLATMACIACLGSCAIPFLFI